MAPSPAAGKSSGAPRTPTKLARRSDKPQTPKAPKLDKPESEAEDVKDKVDDAKESSKVEMKDTSEVDTEESVEHDGKISQAAPKLAEKDPKPIDDDSDVEDTEAGAEEGDDEEDDEEDADDVTEKAGDTAEEESEAPTSKLTGKSAKGKASGVAKKAKDTAKDTKDKAEDTAKGAKGKVEDTADDAKDKADDVADDAEDAADDAEDSVEDAADDAEDAADDAEDSAEDPVEDVKAKAGDVKDEAEEKAPKTPDLSILKDLEVDEKGLIHDKDGNEVGKLVEGDAEDLAGYKIGDDGEILDDEGDLVGRCELTPEKAEELAQQAKGEAEDTAEDATDKVPGLEILEGLSCDATGQIYNDDGDVIGQITEGEAEDLQGRPLNAEGEVLDEDGDVIGRAIIHPDYAAQFEGGEEGDEQDEDEDHEEGEEGAERDADGEPLDTAEGAKDEAGEAIDEAAPELPGIEALEGQQLNDEGQIVDEEGNVLGELAEGDVEKVAGMTINDKGEVVDEEGNVIGKVELAEGAAEQLAEAQEKAEDELPTNDLRILEGLKVNKKGKILDEEGEPIGELIDGDIKKCAGKKVNEKGEVLDKDGNSIGRVKVVPGEASEEATRSLLERLGELESEDKLPGLDILEGLKVNKKGKILNEDGETIGELVDGEIEQCAGKKCNDQGEVLDNKGKVIGRVKTLPQEGAEEEEVEGEEAEGEEAEEEDDNLPPLSVLDGLKVNKAGKLINKDGVIVGELVEGDPKKLSKSGTTCDEEGKFWDSKGHVIGQAKTVKTEDAEDEAPFAGLEGLIVNKEGMIEDENGNVVGKVVEGNPKKLVGRSVDEDGDILDKKGSVVGHAERYEEEDAEEEPEPEAIDLSSLAGKTVNKQGNVIGDEGVPVARLVEGNPKEVAGKKLDKKGQIWNDQGEVIARVELIPQEEREAKPEGPFAGLQGLRVVKDGKVADEDGNIVGEIVEGNAKRLVGLAVDEDGDIIDKYGNVKGHADPIPDEEDEVEEELDLSSLDNKVLNKQGFVVGDDGIPIGRLVEGNAKELAGRRCDEEGLIHSDTGKVVGRCELIPENERVAKKEGPFAGYEGLKVVKDGKVEDEDGNVVGVLVEGNAKRLVGHAVDEDGDIIDKYGNVKGHADPWEEEDAVASDLSALNGCTVNKQGNVVDGNGRVQGRVSEGELKNLIGRKVDGEGQIWDNSGNVIGRAELVQGGDDGAEGPFSGFENITVAKDGTVVTASGDVVGKVIEGDLKKLVGYKVDTDGDISDKNGNTIGKAERFDPEEKERRVNPMSGRRVNKEGEIRDESGELIGRLTAGDLGHCIGLEVDDNGYVVDNDGNKVGEVTLMENITEEEEEEEGDTEEEAQKKKDAEIADKMAGICQQTLERVQPVCKQITEVSTHGVLPIMSSILIRIQVHGASRPHTARRARRGGACQQRQAAHRRGWSHSARMQRLPARPRSRWSHRPTGQGSLQHTRRDARRVSPRGSAQGAYVDGRHDHRQRQEEAQRHAARQEEAEPTVVAAHATIVPDHRRCWSIAQRCARPRRPAAQRPRPRRAGKRLARWAGY